MEIPKSDALIFDGFGTLFDLSSASPAFERILPGRGLEVLNWWRAKQLAYTRQCIVTRRYQNLSELMMRALEDVCKHFRVEISPEMRTTLCAQYLTLTAFPEVPDVLNILRKDHKLILLSHGTQAMLDGVVAHNQLTPLLDAVLSVDAVRAYKPESKAYELARERLNLPASSCVYIGGNPFDIAGAKGFGMKTIWLHRGMPPMALMNLIADESIGSLKDLLPHGCLID